MKEVKLNITTQLSGKFSIEDDTVFRVKNVLESSGAKVVQPLGDEIVDSVGDIGVTFDPSKISFYEVEILLFTAIRRNPIHVVCNQYRDVDGYIGESTSIELAYAMLHDRPIILLHPPDFAESVPTSILNILSGRTSQCHIGPLLNMPQDEIRQQLTKLAAVPIDYQVGLVDEIAILSQVSELLHRYESIEKQ